MTRKSKELIHEGKYAAEVAVDLIKDDTTWSPYLSPATRRREVALCHGNIVEAAKYGRIFELTPVTAK